MPYGFGNQQPIVPPSLNDLNLPPNPFNVLATIAVIRVDDEYSPQSPEPTIPSPISTPPMNVSTIEGWGIQRIPRLTMTHFIQMTSPEESTGIFRRATPSTLTSQEMCLSPRAFFYSTTSTATEEKTKHGDVFSSKGRSVAGHLRGMRPTLTARKATQCLEETQTLTELSI